MGKIFRDENWLRNQAIVSVRIVVVVTKVSWIRNNWVDESNLKKYILRVVLHKQKVNKCRNPSKKDQNFSF